MPYTAKRLFQVQLTTGEVTEYTVSAGRQAILKQITLANTSASAATYAFSIVPSGGTAGASNRIAGDISLPAKTSDVWDFTEVLEAGDFISATASAGTAITMTASGVERT